MDFLNRTFRHWSLLPAVVLFAVLTLYPMANLVRMGVSTIEFSQGAEVWTFTPMRNLDLLRADEVIPPAVRNTLVFVVAAVAIEMVLGLALALLVAGVSRGKGLIRTVMILPILVPPVAIGSMWKLLYNYDFGIFNAALVGLGPAARELARLDDARAVVRDRRRRVALGAVRVPDPLRGGRGASRRRARGGARRRRHARAVLRRVTLPLLSRPSWWRCSSARSSPSRCSTRSTCSRPAARALRPSSSRCTLQGVLRAEPARLRGAAVACA
jgi:hypothetical protein